MAHDFSNPPTRPDGAHHRPALSSVPDREVSPQIAAADVALAELELNVAANAYVFAVENLLHALEVQHYTMKRQQP